MMSVRVVLLLQLAALCIGTTPSTSVASPPQSRPRPTAAVPSTRQTTGATAEQGVTRTLVSSSKQEHARSARTPGQPTPPSDESDNERSDDADFDIDLNEAGPDQEGGDIPQCILGCASKLQACAMTLKTGKPDCDCAEAVLAECQVEEKCDEATQVELSHEKAAVCGLPSNDPLIKEARERLEEEEPQIAHDEDFHPEGPLAKHGDDDWTVDLKVGDGGYEKPCNKTSECDPKAECVAFVCVALDTINEPEPVPSMPPVKAPTARDKPVGKPELFHTPAESVQPAKSSPTSSTEPAKPATNGTREQLQRCAAELAESHANLTSQSTKNLEMRQTLLTLAGTVEPPRNAESIRDLPVYVKRQLETLAKTGCAQASHSTDIDNHPHHKMLKQELAKAGKTTRDADSKLHTLSREHDKLKHVFEELISELQVQDKQPMRGEFWKSSELIEKLHNAVQHGGAIVADGWGEFIDKLTERHAGGSEDGLTDPVAMGMTYGAAAAPAILLACFSRFQAIKDLFILQGLLFNCAFTGMFGLLAVLALYCQFNPLKIVIGQPTKLPAFELVFLGSFVYVAACNVMLVFVQPGAVEKLHAFFSVVLGAHLYWMLYTLRSEDSGLQHLFFGVYFVCFLGCCIAKLRGVAVLHLTSVRKTKGSNKKAIRVKDDENSKGAVFELGDDLETAGLVD